MILPTADAVRLSQADIAIIWEIAHELDYRKFCRSLPDDPDASVWLTFASARLRNPDGRDDNFYIKKRLKKLQGISFEGNHDGTEWGAVLVSEYRIKQGGSIIEICIPPAGVKTVLAPNIFAKIEAEAKYRMKGAAALLYTHLAAKKSLKNKFYEYDLEEIYEVCQCSGKYPRFADFNRYILKPAIDDINTFGTVKLKVTYRKTGRSVTGLRIDWDWKTPHEAHDTSKANDNHSSSRGKEGDGTAPPLTDYQEKQAISYIDWQRENPGASYGEYKAWEQEKGS